MFRHRPPKSSFLKPALSLCSSCAFFLGALHFGGTLGVFAHGHTLPHWFKTAITVLGPRTFHNLFLYGSLGVGGGAAIVLTLWLCAAQHDVRKIPPGDFKRAPHYSDERIGAAVLQAIAARNKESLLFWLDSTALLLAVSLLLSLLEIDQLRQKSQKVSSDHASSIPEIIQQPKRSNNMCQCVR